MSAESPTHSDILLPQKPPVGDGDGVYGWDSPLSRVQRVVVEGWERPRRLRIGTHVPERVTVRGIHRKNRIGLCDEHSPTAGQYRFRGRNRGYSDRALPESPPSE